MSTIRIDNGYLHLKCIEATNKTNSMNGTFSKMFLI